MDHLLLQMDEQEVSHWKFGHWKAGQESFKDTPLNIALFSPEFNTFLSWDQEWSRLKGWRQAKLLFSVSVFIAWGLESPTQPDTLIISALVRNVSKSSLNATYKVFISNKPR